MSSLLSLLLPRLGVRERVLLRVYLEDDEYDLVRDRERETDRVRERLERTE